MTPGPIVKVEDWAARQRLFGQLYAMGRRCIGPDAPTFIKTFTPHDIADSVYVWFSPKHGSGFWLCDRADLADYLKTRSLTLVNSPAQFIAYGRRHGMLPQVPDAQ